MKKSRKLAWVVLGVVCLLGVILEGWRSRQSANFVSCRNHATFVARALDGHIAEHGWLPHVSRLPGEDLFCRLDFYGSVQNCHAGAPGQGHGGWQMVNASRKTWDAVVSSFPNEMIPVVWCGRAHRFYSDGPRIVICIPGRRDSSLTSSQLREKWYDSDSQMLDLLGMGIVYGMSEKELETKITRMNLVVRDQGELDITIDVVGRSDYWSLALPYQTEDQ